MTNNSKPSRKRSVGATNERLHRSLCSVVLLFENFRWELNFLTWHGCSRAAVKHLPLPHGTRTPETNPQFGDPTPALLASLHFRFYNFLSKRVVVFFFLRFRIISLAVVGFVTLNPTMSWLIFVFPCAKLPELVDWPLTVRLLLTDIVLVHQTLMNAHAQSVFRAFELGPTSGTLLIVFLCHRGQPQKVCMSQRVTWLPTAVSTPRRRLYRRTRFVLSGNFVWSDCFFHSFYVYLLLGVVTQKTFCGAQVDMFRCDGSVAVESLSASKVCPVGAGRVLGTREITQWLVGLSEKCPFRNIRFLSGSTSWLIFSILVNRYIITWGVVSEVSDDVFMEIILVKILDDMKEKTRLLRLNRFSFYGSAIV